MDRDDALRERLLDERGALHASHHNLVPVEVGEVLARLLLGDLLTPRGRLPLPLDVRGFDRRCEDLLGGGLLLEIHNEGGDGETAEGDHAALDVGRVDENLGGLEG